MQDLLLNYSARNSVGVLLLFIMGSVLLPFWHAHAPIRQWSRHQALALFFFLNHFRLRKFPNQSGQRSNSTRSHTPIGSSLAAAEIKHP